MTDAITSLLNAQHLDRLSQQTRPLRRLPSAAESSLSPGNRRHLKPGGQTVIRVEVPQVCASDAPWAALTPRQFEVLTYLVEGAPTKVICRSLCMSEGTAKVHISAILRALNVQTRTEAVLAAVRAGWIQPVASAAQ
jgi:DNA-binding NarL/FixJ family response regulator